MSDEFQTMRQRVEERLAAARAFHAEPLAKLEFIPDPRPAALASLASSLVEAMKAIGNAPETANANYLEDPAERLMGLAGELVEVSQVMRLVVVSGEGKQ